MTFSANVSELFEKLGEAGPMSTTRKMVEAFWGSDPLAPWGGSMRQIYAPWFAISLNAATAPVLFTSQVLGAWAAAPAKAREAARAAAREAGAPAPAPEQALLVVPEPDEPAAADPVQAEVPVEVGVAPAEAQVEMAGAEPEQAETDGRPAGLDGPRDGLADDLKLINGIGPKIERTLNGLGIYHFDQIAAWTERQEQWVDEHLRFSGRIRRDEWIAQADALASGGVTEYVDRFGKAPL